MTYPGDSVDITRDPLLQTPGRRLNNWIATTDPGPDNDDDDGPGLPGSHSGYEVGSRWLNKTTGVMWTCVDNTVGAAMWTAGAGGSGGGDVHGYWQDADPGTPPFVKTIWFDTDATPTLGVPDFGVAGDLSQIDYGDAAVAGSTGRMPDAGHQHPLNPNLQHASLTFEFGPNAAVNDYHVIPIPWDFTPVGWRIIGDVSGSVSFGVWMDVLANGQPTAADSIVASAPPSVSGAIQGSSTTLTGWDTTWLRGDLLKVIINTLTTMTQVTVEFYGNKT